MCQNIYNIGVVINNYYSFKNDRIWPRNATFTDCRPTPHGAARKEHKVGIIQAVTVQYRYISSSFSFQGESLESSYHLAAVSGAHFTQGTILIVILVSSGSSKSRTHQSKFKRSPNTNNFNDIKVFRAKARRTIKISKRKSWRTYVSKINHKTPIKKVWDMIRKISGKNSFTHLNMVGSDSKQLQKQTLLTL